LAAWMIMDLRWTSDRARQMHRSWDALATHSVNERISASVLGRFYGYISEVRDELIGTEPARVLLVLDPYKSEYFALRSKYQLLPHSVRVVKSLDDRFVDRDIDYVLFLGRFGVNIKRKSVREDVPRRIRQLPISNDWYSSLRLLDVNQQGLLFEIKTGDEAQDP